MYRIKCVMSHNMYLARKTAPKTYVVVGCIHAVSDRTHFKDGDLLFDSNWYKIKKATEDDIEKAAINAL